MKNLFFVLLLAVGLGSCAKDEILPIIKVNATDKIAITEASNLLKNGMLRAESLDTIHLSALEIVKQTYIISFKDTLNGTLTMCGRSFAPEQRDTISETPKLLMWATDVISQSGELQTGFAGSFLQAKDVVLVRRLNGNDQTFDTIACIRNSVLREAEAKITAAFYANNPDSCRVLFNNAYKYEKCTGEEWRKMKALNQQ